MRYVVLGSLLLAAALSIAAQTSTTPRTPANPSSKNIPRAPDGRPDLQGMWTNSTLTPLERPKQFENKAYFNESEEAAFRSALFAELAAVLGGADNQKTNGDQSFRPKLATLLPDHARR